MTNTKLGAAAGFACDCCAAVLCVALLAGCDPVSLTVFGVGAATGVQHKIGRAHV